MNGLNNACEGILRRLFLCLLMFFHEQILMNVYSLWTTVTMTQQHAITLLEASTVPAYLITLQSLNVRTSVIVSVDYNICHIY